jgi:hypothetical protein
MKQVRLPLWSVFMSMFLMALNSQSIGKPDVVLADAQPPGTFTVTVRDGKVSLDANKAVVMKVVQELAQVTGVTVEGQPENPEATITVRLERIPVEEAFQRLVKNVAIFSSTDARTGKQRVSRVVLHKEGTGSATVLAEDPTATPPSEEPTPAPFSFTFDPSQAPGDQ